MTTAALDYMTREIVGPESEKIASLTIIKKEPAKAIRAISNMMTELATVAAFQTGEPVFVYGIEDTAKEIIENCKRIYAKEMESIK